MAVMYLYRWVEQHHNISVTPTDQFPRENMGLTLTLSLSFDGIGAFKYPAGRFEGGSGGLVMLNRPYKIISE